MSGEVRGSGRRRRRRSGSQGGHHKRRREREDPVSTPSRPPFEEYWSSPPTGWHGSAGGPTPGYPPRPGPPPGPGYALRPAPPPYDPYAYHPGNEVPPPPGMDVGKGHKGKGKGKLDDSEGRGSDGLILSNVPPEVNTLDALNRHFRHFGEVLKIISQVSEGKAYVQFASKASAEAAAQAPALGRPEIVVAWEQRPKGKGSAKGKSDGRPAEHRVLCTDPNERRKIEDIKVKREELASRKTALLANLTNQIKANMAKINDENISEAKRETLRSLLLGLKEKMDSLSGPSKQDATRTLMDHPRYEPSRDTRDVPIGVMHRRKQMQHLQHKKQMQHMHHRKQMQHLHQRKQMQHLHHRKQMQQPAPEEADAAPAPQEADAAIAPQEADAALAPQEADAAPAPEEADAAPAPQEADAADAAPADIAAALAETTAATPES
eukprot:symbB.v1.2.002567.t1/scaffold136.1/size304296/20